VELAPRFFYFSTLFLFREAKMNETRQRLEASTVRSQSPAPDLAPTGSPQSRGQSVIVHATETLLALGDLPRSSARDVIDHIMQGHASSPQIAAFLIALRMKGETAAEIAGCAEAMAAHMVPVSPEREDLIDTAGTGGDGTGSFNISTAAALVAAAAGAGVAKHGNRAVSSASGSADVLEALGFDLNLDPALIAQSIDRYGFGFLFAPLHHPAMRHAVPVRKELATRTVFNILGPLTNPARAQAQIVGVYAPELAATVARVMVLLGTKRALVIHGADGLDELSPSGVNLVYEVTDGKIEETTLDPADLGMTRCHVSQLRGATPAENATTTRSLLRGAPGPLRDAVLLNAGAALRVAGIADGYRDGLDLASTAIDSGAAAERLDALVAFSRRQVEMAG
jgi:anthranilate phosphoribosyltransferase